MAGVKKSWKAAVLSIRSALIHKYQGNTCIGAVSRVQMLVIISEGRERGRLIAVNMTTEEAEQHVSELQAAIKATKESDFLTV